MTGAARGTAHSGILLGVAQFWLAAAGYVVAVVLGRVLGPEAYGIYGIIYSLLLGIELIGRLGIPQALSRLIASLNHDDGSVNDEADREHRGVAERKARDEPADG